MPDRAPRHPALPAAPSQARRGLHRESVAPDMTLSYLFSFAAVTANLADIARNPGLLIARKPRLLLPPPAGEGARRAEGGGAFEPALCFWPQPPSYGSWPPPFAARQGEGWGGVQRYPQKQSTKTSVLPSNKTSKPPPPSGFKAKKTPDRPQRPTKSAAQHSDPPQFLPNQDSREGQQSSFPQQNTRSA